MYCYFCMNESSEQNGCCTRCGKSFAKDENRNHLLPGTMLKQKYMVGNVLGQGGFGITYAGRDTTLDIRIAIKEYFPIGHASRDSLASNEVTLLSGPNESYYANGKQRFLSEAKALAKFNRSGNIVHARDYFELHNTAYIIMDFVKGQDLRHYLHEHGKIEPQQLVDWFLPILRVLGKVHAEGIIHRDISPDNIIVENSELILIDFGAARDVGATKSMSVMLKPGYAPGEQYTSDRSQQGPWTDIYAVCATMYECITGETPQESSSRLFEDKLQPPSAYGISIPPHIEAALMHGMANRYKDRPQNMQQLIAELNGTVAAPPIKPVPQTPVQPQPAAVPISPVTVPEPDPQTVLMDDPKTVLMDKPSEAIVTGVEIGQLTTDVPLQTGVLTKPMPDAQTIHQNPEPQEPQEAQEAPDRTKKNKILIAAAACFLLIVGGIGVTAALSKDDKPPLTITATNETTTTQTATETTAETLATMDVQVTIIPAKSTAAKTSAKTKPKSTTTTATDPDDDSDTEKPKTSRTRATRQEADSPYEEPSYDPEPDPEPPRSTANTTKATKTTKSTTKTTKTTPATTKETEPPVTEPWSEFEYMDYNGGVIITGWKTPSELLAIPEEINGKPVVAINEGAFQWMDTLRAVTFPDSDAEPKIEIFNDAFYGNENLEWVLISNKVAFIGDNAFGCCKNLSNIFISYSVTDIGRNCFIDDENQNYTVYYEGSQWEWDSINAFNAFSESFQLYCPTSQSDFLSIVAF